MRCFFSSSYFVFFGFCFVLIFSPLRSIPIFFIYSFTSVVFYFFVVHSFIPIANFFPSSLYPSLFALRLAARFSYSLAPYIYFYLLRRCFHSFGLVETWTLFACTIILYQQIGRFHKCCRWLWIVSMRYYSTYSIHDRWVGGIFHPRMCEWLRFLSIWARWFCFQPFIYISFDKPNSAHTHTIQSTTRIIHEESICGWSIWHASSGPLCCTYASNDDACSACVSLLHPWWRCSTADYALSHL